MKKMLLLFVMMGSLMFVTGQALAIMITLDPTPQKIYPPGNLYVDINISGLQSGNVDTLLGAFSLDLLYDPGVLRPLISDSIPGGRLGDVLSGETVWGIDSSVSGVLGITEVSLLEANNATCIFCFPPYLEDLQLDSFTLATMAFFAYDAPGGPVTFLDTTNVVLSDANGFQVTDLFGNIASVATSMVAVKVPEPGTFLLLGVGMIGMLTFRRKKVLSEYINGRL